MYAFARLVVVAGMGMGCLFSSSRVDAAPSHEDEKVGNRVAILQMQVEGRLTEGLETALGEQLVRGLLQGGLDVLAPERLAELSGISHCDNERCMTLLANAVQARWIVRARISVVDKNYEVKIDAHDGADGSLVGSSSESCELCGAAEVEDLMLKQAAGLRAKLEALALGPAVYRFTSEPTGARVMIDGKLVGTTPFEREMPPGEHRAEIALPGFLPQERTITAVKGVRETVAFQLQPEAAPIEDSSDVGRRRPRTWPVGWGLFGTGLASTAAGVTFLVLHHRPYRAQCSGDDVDVDGNCRQRYRTLPHGAALTAVGGALLTTGIALIVAGRKKKSRRKADERQARVTLQPGGFGLGGRF